ncbi:MAG: hypothetical protein OXH86_05880 [Acidimicrobiaceae bacterium]|uniref:hypothetical protein n=1 Tax=Candidatus Poriferisodalis multihospitum TaxID=2983191 RepID=UPI0023A4640B|nr:hypothetical protein [Candidatus Poriferisodalis multihospitum]MDE0135936.1 hypothetical protein [Acidimicrobiaceae bacterium]MDE0496862.1 hypothetical protein [Acidimicrobiaceae bacterium]
MAVLDSIRDMQDRTLEQMKTAQEQFVSMNERVAEAWLSAVPAASSPFAEYLPKPTEMIDTYFSFWSQVHEANKDCAARIAAAWERASEDAQA